MGGTASRARAGQLAFCLCALAACGREEPPARGEQYPLAAEQNVDGGGLERAHAALSANPHARCLLVERNGVLVMEDYYGGATADTSFDVRSVTKSVVSLLIGQAIEAGHITSVDQTIGDFLDHVLPELASEKRQITLRQLLTMTSGLPWREIGSQEQDFGAWLGSGDQLMWILERPFDHAPGELWHYNTAASHVLSAVLTEATGRTTRDLAQEGLFGPLGGEVGAWPRDSRGYDYGGHGINLTARTMARLGRLVRDGGVWGGRQIVPRAWIEQSTRSQVATTGAIPWAGGYGYLWWMTSDPRTGLRLYYANGYGGQFIVNVPERNATIVATTVWSGLPGATANANWREVLGTIVETVVPSLR